MRWSRVKTGEILLSLFLQDINDDSVRDNKR